MKAFALGAQVAAARLRSRTLGVLTVFGLLTVAVVALLERRTGSVLSTDRALAGVALGLCLPALAYGVVRTATGGQRLANSLWPMARYGQNRRRIALGVLSAATLANAGIGLVLAVLCVLCVRLPADPLLVPDALTSAWIGAAGGAAYTALFLCGSTLGRAGGGAFLLLALDFALGAGTGVAAAIWPRAHVRNLLGGAAPLELPQFASSALLLALFLLLVTFATQRTPK
ncbi:MAG TPA: hypothetical protein PKA88_10455 [Polyangiaceae bacterium]|nr:hypothetical protein [Polyangiaceae bacterium]